MSEDYVQAVFSAQPGSWPSLTKDVNNGIEGVIPDQVHALVLEFTDALTLGPEVPPELFGRMRDAFGEREIVEITATVGCYNCVSRFLVALDVGERLGQQGLNAAISHAGGVKVGTHPAPRTYVS